MVSLAFAVARWSSNRRPRIEDPDIELFLTGWLRRELAARTTDPICQGVKVSNREPEPPATFPPKLVVIRYDGGPDTSLVSSEASIGVSVLAGTKDSPQEANDLARRVKAILKDCAAVEPGNPVSAVLASNGPYPVPEDQPKARRYMTFTLALVGQELT